MMHSPSGSSSDPVEPTETPRRRLSAWRLGLAGLLALSASLSSSAFAQSAANFPVGKAAPSEASLQPPEAGAPAGSIGGPSRYVSPDSLSSYVETLSATFSMKARAVDPFGQLQDPSAKPLPKPSATKSIRRVAPSQVTPFAEIIRRIQVTIIMPEEQKFLIGTRSFKRGDRFPMNFRGRSTKVEVAAVTAREITFLNVDSGEKASLKLNLLPKGMNPGTHGITAPGMSADRADRPLEIESIPSSP